MDQERGPTRWSGSRPLVLNGVPGDSSGLELAADVLHMAVDGAIVRLGVGAARGVEQLGAGEDPAGVAGESGEDLELGGGEVDRLPPPAPRPPGDARDTTGGREG